MQDLTALYNTRCKVLKCAISLTKKNLNYFMKLTSSVMSLFILSIQLLVAAPSIGQSISNDKMITFGASNEKLSDVLKKIEKLSGYRIAYPSEEVSRYSSVTLSEQSRSIDETLQAVLSAKAFDFSYEENTIVVFNKTEAATSAQIVSPPREITGTLLDDKGEPVMGASVVIKGTKTGTTTDKNGNFSIVYPNDGDAVLVITHIGFAPKEIIIKKGDNRNSVITMIVGAQALKDVEISTGIGANRKKEAIAGATSVFSGEKLISINPQNIMQGLSLLDPSFVIVANNSFGSSPTALPNIELRGQTAIPVTQVGSTFSQNPNEPLFVLDGIIVPLKTILNLDMSRIATVTLLKDPASAAVWGSFSANGVVVVETKRPIPGKLSVNYQGTLNVQVTDLGSYNLMNASEKLEFEKESGLYSSGLSYDHNLGYYVFSPVTVISQQGIYNAKLSEIKRGVNSYWLSDPVRNGIQQIHALSLSGGSQDVYFTAGGNVNFNNGVMKGSNNRSWNGYTTLTYRKSKINVVNNLNVSGYTQNESPYGSFSLFAQANPYYRKTDSSGAITKYLDQSLTGYVDVNGNDIENVPPTINPLYNPQFPGINQVKDLNIREDLSIIYKPISGLQIIADASIVSDNQHSILFIDPRNLQYVGVDKSLSGSFTDGRTEQNQYTGNFTASYAKAFEKNLIALTARGTMSETKFNTDNYTAVGYTAVSSATLGAGATPDSSTPATSFYTNARNVSATANLSYSYDDRYAINGTYTKNGNNSFGSKSRYYDTWVVGGRWNLHHEHFAQDNASWLTQLDVFGNFSSTSTQQTAGFTDGAVYNAIGGSSSTFGDVIDLVLLGNPNLRTPISRQTSLGIEFGFLNNRLSGNIQYYQKNTSPNIVQQGSAGLLPSSVGLPNAYSISVGRLVTKGVDFAFQITPISHSRNNLVWTIGVNGQTVDSRYAGLGNSLQGFNKQELASNGLVRYSDGFSTTDIWAVRSAGIDPATGRELFFKKDGSLTFTYNTDDIVRVGNSRPQLAGTINTTFSYKQFSLAVYTQYYFNGYRENAALYNSVENIDLGSVRNNQDRRALYDRWKQPGDVSQFKNIYVAYGSTSPAGTPLSSRFIERDSYLDGSSITLSWNALQAGGKKWLDKVGLKNLTASCTANEIFRFETIKSERGTDYPYARAVSFTLNANF
jgi:TonB-linked SusC/RagA family outer membrane protein